MSSWKLIQDVHTAVNKGSSPPSPWHECLNRLLKIVKTFKPDDPVEKVDHEPPVRDQMLVLLTIFLNLSDPMKYNVNVDIPLEDLSSAMVNLIVTQADPYITNLATRCLCQCLASKRSEASDGEWYTVVLQPCFGCLRSGERLGSVIDLFRLVFSKKSMAAVGGNPHDIEKVRVWCVQKIIRLWRPLVEDVLAAGIPDQLTGDTTHVDPKLVSLLSLWVKLIKTHHTHLASDLLALDEQAFAPLQTTTVRLVTILTRRRLTPLVFDKICDVLNRTLLYGSSTDQFQYGTGQGHGFSVDLGADVLRSVQMGLLDLVPLDAGERGFVGSQCVKGAEKELEEGDGLEKTNMRSVRKVALLILKACAIITRSATYAGISLGAVELVLETLWSWAQQTVPPDDPHHWLVTVFGDQDDYLVEAMLCLLDIHTTIRWKAASPSGDARPHQGSDPHSILLHFLTHTSFDHTVLLDLLTSPETCFLLYLVRYLHHAQPTWDQLADACFTWQPLPGDEQRTPRPETGATPCPLSCSANQSSFTPSTGEPGQQGQDNMDSKISKDLKETADSLDFAKPSGVSVMPKSPLPFDTGTGCPMGVTSAPPDVVLTPPEETIPKELPKSPIKPPSDGGTNPRAPSGSQKLVEYSDDSLTSDSETEGEPDGPPGPTPSANNLLSADRDHDALDSAASDLGRSLTASLTSLTSVTSDLEMPSDLQDVGMETDVEDDVLDNVMGVLIRLRLVIERLDEKGLFPYNAAALLRLLRQTEALYDGEEA